jgi:hypothetical protein
MPFTAEDTAAREAAIAEQQRTQAEFVRAQTELEKMLCENYPEVELQKARIWWALVNGLNKKLHKQYCGGKEDLRVSSTEQAWPYQVSSLGKFGLSKHQAPDCAEVLTRMARAENDYGQTVVIGNYIHGKITITMTAPLPAG